MAIVLNGRISTKTAGGSAISIPSTHPFGEGVELRYTSALSNTQFQGMYVRADTTVANSSTIRGAEFVATRGGDVAVGTLEGINSAGYLRTTGTGAVTNAFGITGEVQADSGYAGTVTLAAAVRGKFQIEDGATYTRSYVFQADLEAVTGGARVLALIGVGTVGGAATARYGIDTTSVEFTNGSGNEVVLWAFKGADGTTYYVVHDTDSATALGVVTTDPTS